MSFKRVQSRKRTVLHLGHPVIAQNYVCHLSIVHLFIIMALETAACHTVFFPRQLYMKISITRSWGDIVAVQGQVLFELLAAAHFSNLNFSCPKAHKGSIFVLVGYRQHSRLALFSVDSRSSKPQQISLSLVPAATGLIRSNLCKCSLLVETRQ